MYNFFQPFYGGKKHKIIADVYNPNEKKPFLTIDGEWNGRMMAKWNGEVSHWICFDMKNFISEVDFEENGFKLVSVNVLNLASSSVDVNYTLSLVWNMLCRQVWSFYRKVGKTERLHEAFVRAAKYAVPL